MSYAFIFLVLIVVVAFAGIFMLGRRRLPKAQPALDHDAALIEHLRASDADLSKPHKIDFYLYLPNEDAANAALARAQAVGYRGDVSISADGNGWLCLLHKDLVPVPATMAEQRRVLTKLAADAGGEYDGWGTTPVTS
jgi:hypothetical protein